MARARRVAVTGLGPLGPGAWGRQELWALLNQRGGEREPVAPLGSMPEIDGTGGDGRLRHADRVARLALEAVRLAVTDAGLERGHPLLAETGIALGSGLGCVGTNADYLQVILAKGPRRGNPILFQNTVPNAAAGYASLAWNLTGPTATFCSGAVAGLEALSFAADIVRRGDAPAMLAVAADELSPWLREHYESRGELAPSGVPRPLDRRRDGTVLSEASCALVLEEMGAARRRGAVVYAEVEQAGEAGGGADDGARALAGAIADALAERGRGEGPGAVMSGAAGSRDGDSTEADGLRRALGNAAGEVPVACPKGALGETFGGAGLLASAAAALALSLDALPSTPHSHEPDPALGVRLAAPGEPTGARVLVTALGDDGTARAQLLGRAS